MRRKVPSLAIAVALLVSTNPSRADGWNVFTVGPMGGIVFGPEQPVLGLLGGEATFVHYASSTGKGLGYGGFVQASTVGFERLRVSFGPQINTTIFGAEVGATFESATKDRAAFVGAHLAPFVSVGFASLMFQVDLPFASLTNGPLPPVELVVAGTLKLPIDLEHGVLLQP
ncbi:hypothetical protein [Polyangium mundeleinium]|uniref:Outer membrane protein beta-barrel domain-containing protein n=1 Tax=Polyangium mundeleinium TaxID=2995306 RepID=A0ABT5EFG0_9BACT|nr:hypothetical protein [Polyangium mundeleinium]MDC0740092.1 hypothetical protein [Polyangium mundeleinium]